MIPFLKASALTFTFLCLTFEVAAQSIPEQFNEIAKSPRTIFYSNALPLNEEGGHLQGVQFHPSGDDSFVLSGSSSTYAYYLVVIGNQVIQVVELGQKPMKHAGGIQLADGYLAVGIEDNSAKDKSEVHIYQIDGSEIQEKPNWVIYRKGEVMRATAGSVGIVREQNELLVAVGDWDSKNLDFYHIDLKAPGSSLITPFATVETKRLPRADWIDDSWHSYQNINLIRDDDGKLYLVGMGVDEKEQNVADLYEVVMNDDGCVLKKVSSRTFQSDPAVSFRAGAGIQKAEDGKLRVISCGNHIGKGAILQIWE
ncbi:hypothetical protein GCM10009119_05830 [Algoriphagus jejuensis]|uniref:Uncharacterized protein n=1 Tax=Algoriphagus jejuensis TaxID=419934 RepID=A0ABP3Y807_9BACT